ncbi:Transcriptional activator [gamma proteobacterium HdN1]|nr:Transcriptional activator [gamma proteobacterium HdN1]
MSRFPILLVEDDADLRDAVSETLSLKGYDVEEAENGEAALTAMSAQPFSMVISDVNMPRMDGFQLLRKIASEWPQIPVVIVTAYGNVENAVQAIRNGAVDFLEKPFSIEKLLETVARHVPEVEAIDAEQPIARDVESLKTFQLADKVAKTDSTVLIMGESGTGKEVLAHYIHNNSPRADQPFVAINCAAIPENMLEAMLFGHEKGSFTGAHQSQPGKFELANGGTLLLDEISEMDVSLQAKLLRVLQEREVERIGGKRAIPLDVRVLATTNRNLRAEVEAGRFREDLYYRLAVFPLRWKPLRERKGDIIPLAEAILRKKADASSVVPVLSEAARERLLAHRWPGNIRELDNVMQRAMILATGGTIEEEDIFIIEDDLEMALEDEMVDEGKGLLDEDLRQREFQIIIETLKLEGGSKKNTAARLGISPRTLRYKLARMREHGIDIERLVA